MHFFDSEQERRFRQTWEAVRIVRPVHYSLFTFGDSVLPYYLVCSAAKPGDAVSLRRGEVRIARPTILTPDNMHPQFRNFFESQGDMEMVEFMLARTAAFSHLQFDNQSAPARNVTDSVEETVARLNRQLDLEEEDRVAVLTAPPQLAGIAVLRYATERVMQSAADNVQELRERGFLS